MSSMEPTDVETNPQEHDPFENLIELESVTAAQGIFPEELFFWRRWQRKSEAAS